MSFNTSNIQADSLVANQQIKAPKHIVGTVELTEDNNNLAVIGVNCEIVNTDNLVSSVSVDTPLLTSPPLFPLTVSNLKTIQLNSGSGSVGQVLALDASSNLVWVDNFSSPQGLASVLGVSNDASGLEINNLLKLTPVSGAGTKDQVLSCDASGNLDWITLAKPSDPTLSQVLTAGNDATNQDISGVNNLNLKNLNLVNTANWSLTPNSLTNNLDLSTSTGGYLNLGSVNEITTGQIMASLLVGKKPSYDYWVCAENGSNIDAVSNGGSLENPFKTISACVNYCESLTASDNIYRYIHILGGNYNENITITKKVYLMGEATTSQSASVGCCVNGNITINVNANGGDLFNNGVHISGLLVNGTVQDDSNINHMLIIENTYIYTPNDVQGRGLYFNSTSASSRLKLWNCQIISGGSSGLSPLMEVNSQSQLSMDYCYLSAKGSQNVLLISQTATCDHIANCKFENSNSATVSQEAICKISSNVNGTYSFANCAFIYSNGSNKSANGVACGILNQNGAGNNTIISLYNTFLLAGTTKNDNFAIQDVNHATATQMICLYYMSGALPNTAFAIRGNSNVNKFQLEVVS